MTSDRPGRDGAERAPELIRKLMNYYIERMDAEPDLETAKAAQDFLAKFFQRNMGDKEAEQALPWKDEGKVEAAREHAGEFMAADEDTEGFL